jgi:hypothetical protein
LSRCRDLRNIEVNRPIQYSDLKYLNRIVEFNKSINGSVSEINTSEPSQAFIDSSNKQEGSVESELSSLLSYDSKENDKLKLFDCFISIGFSSIKTLESQLNETLKNELSKLGITIKMGENLKSFCIRIVESIESFVINNLIDILNNQSYH